MKPLVEPQEAICTASSLLGKVPSGQTVSTYMLIHPAFLKHLPSAWHCPTIESHVPHNKTETPGNCEEQTKDSIQYFWTQGS